MKGLLRLIEPIRVLPKLFILNTLEGTLLAGYYIFSFEILRKVLRNLEEGNMNEFYVLLYWYAGISVIFIAIRFTFYKQGWTTIMYLGRSLYYEKYLKIFIAGDGNQIEKIGTGRFINILKTGISHWLEGLWELSYIGVKNIILYCYAIYFTFTITETGGWIGVSITIALVLVSIPVNKWMRNTRFLRHHEDKEGEHQAVIALMSKNELLQNSGLSKILKKINSSFEKAMKYGFSVNVGFLFLEEFPRFIFLILRIGIYIFIAESLSKGELRLADLAIFITVITVMEKAINELFDIIRGFLRNLSGIELLWNTFDSLKPIKGYSTGLPFTPNIENIILKNISYKYGESPVFRDFSLTIEKGKKTAFVGASGGGKTTLIKLIAGYLHPESGSISVMGNILSETALKTYYPHIGYLTQDPSVFDATIRENLLSALPENTDTGINEKLLIEALRHAKCEFVFEMKDGLDTEIGERGVRLSGGQKQRLAIAKIFLKNPEIILLDEPTSALDSFSEEQITEALDTLFEGRTVIIVAHRLQTVKKADDIIVIEKGQVAERGTHASLTKAKGIYQKMLELQSGF